MSEYVEQLRADLLAVREAKRELRENGQTVSISGAFSQTKVSLADLNKEEARLQKALAAALTGSAAGRRREIPRYE